MERRAGAERAGARQLRPRRRHLRRRANRHAGGAQRRAPSRKSSLSSCAAPAGRSLPCSKAAFRSTDVRSGCSASNRSRFPAEVGNAPAIGRAGLQSFLTPPGETLVAPGRADRSQSCGRRDAADERRHAAAAAARAGATGAGRAGGRYRHRASAAEQAGSDFPAPDRQDQQASARRSKASSATSSAWSQPDAESDLERLTDSFHLNLTAFGLLSFVVGLFIVNSAIGLAFEQRLPMLRTLRACGVSARMLNSVLVVELVSLALVAGLVGLVCGYLIAAALLPDVAASLRGLYGAQIPGQLTLKPEWWIAGIVISVAGALAAATTSLAKAIRLPVLAAAQPYAWQQAQHRWLILQSALALAVLAAAGLLLWYGNSLVSGFAVLAALAAWRGADPAGDPGARAVVRPAAGRWRARGLVLGRQPPAAFGIVAGADGAAARARGQCRRRHHGGNLQPHLCHLARWAAGGGRLSQRRRRRAGQPRSRHGCAGVPKSRRSCPAAGPRCRWRARRSKSSGIADHATYRDHWPLLQADRQRLEKACFAGDAGLVSEQLARRLKLGIGDSIEIPAPGGNWKLEIVGIYADYGNPKGQVAVNIAAFTRRFPRRAADADGPARLARGGAGADLGACRKNSASTAAT